MMIKHFAGPKVLNGGQARYLSDQYFRRLFISYLWAYSRNCAFCFNVTC